MPVNPNYLKILSALISPILVLFLYSAIAESFEKNALETSLLEQKAMVAEEISDVALVFDKEILKIDMLTLGLKAYIESNLDYSDEEFKAVVNSLLEANSNIYSIVIAPNYIVKDIYPEIPGNNGYGVDFRDYPNRIGLINKALETNKSRLGGPRVILTTNDVGIYLRTPVLNKDGSPWGIISTVILLDKINKPLDAKDGNRNIHYAIRGVDGLGSEGEIFDGNPSIFEKNYIPFKISVPGGLWVVGALPKNGWATISDDNNLIQQFTLISMFAVTLILFFVFKYVDGQATARKMSDQANQAKSQFIANMSHELRTPLNAILGFGEMLHEDLSDKEMQKQVEFTGYIIESGKNLLGLINSILDISKIESGKFELNNSSFDVKDLVEKTTNMSKPLLDNGENVFEVTYTKNLGLMLSDKDRIQQILFNLISNAAKFTCKGKISLQVESQKVKNENFIVFSIKDTGIGMTKEQVDNVFNRFYQADGSTQRNYGGTGLGMAIVQDFTKLLGGTIQVESELDVGTTFTIKIKNNQNVSTMEDFKGTTKEEVLVHEFNQENNYKGKSFKALIIDNETLARQITKKHIPHADFEIFEACSGQEGIEVARKVIPDIVLLDIMMPGMDGWSVLEIFKADEDLKNIPIILCTMIDEENRGYILGADGYVHKPINRNELLESINKNINTINSNSLIDVLVVEDDEINLDMMRSLLKKENYKIRTANNGAEALWEIKKKTPDLMILDLMMPVMDGYQTLSTLRKNPEYNDLPVVVMTAKYLTKEDRKILSDQVSNVIQKGLGASDNLLKEITRQLKKN